MTKERNRSPETSSLSRGSSTKSKKVLNKRQKRIQAVVDKQLEGFATLFEDQLSAEESCDSVEMAARGKLKGKIESLKLEINDDLEFDLDEEDLTAEEVSKNLESLENKRRNLLECVSELEGIDPDYDASDTRELISSQINKKIKDLKKKKKELVRSAAKDKQDEDNVKEQSELQRMTLLGEGIQSMSLLLSTEFLEMLSK